jgi:hypothetical protein
MIVEAKAANCFSSTYVLKINHHAAGKFESRWFSESIDIALTGRRRLIFQKLGWLGSEFVLRAAEAETFLGHATRAGFLTSSWHLDLSIGPCTLAKSDWFDSGYSVQQSGLPVGRVERLGWCERGWQASSSRLTEEDLILVGLVYHTVLRRAQAAAAHGGAGS